MDPKTKKLITLNEKAKAKAKAKAKMLFLVSDKRRIRFHHWKRR